MFELSLSSWKWETAIPHIGLDLSNVSSVVPQRIFESDVHFPVSNNNQQWLVTFWNTSPDWLLPFWRPFWPVRMERHSGRQFFYSTLEWKCADISQGINCVSLCLVFFPSQPHCTRDWQFNLEAKLDFINTCDTQRNNVFLPFDPIFFKLYCTNVISHGSFVEVLISIWEPNICNVFGGGGQIGII